MKSSTSLTTVAVGLLLFAMGSAATAQTTFVAARAGLNANDFLNWGTVGSDGDQINGPYSTTTNGGLGITLSSSNNHFFRKVQGADWSGNFAAGANLIEAYPGSMTITFTNAVAAAGLQIESNVLGSWNANITAYDTHGTALGSFTGTDNATANEDDSALFLGVKSTSANIASITFDDPATGFFGPSDYFLVNQLDINTNSAPVVPEGSSDLMLLAGMSVPGAGYLLRRLRSRA